MNRPDYIAVVDCGHGEVTAVIIDTKTWKEKMVSRPFMRARVTGDTFGLGDKQEHETAWVDWYGRRYVTGFECLNVLSTRANIERHSGRERYGNEHMQFSIADLLARGGIKLGTVALTVFVPPKFWSDQKDSIKRAFLREPNNGLVEIRLKNDKKLRQWQYVDVTVLPEGLSGAFVLALNPDGTLNRNSLLKSAVLVDQGMNTCDAIEVAGGKFNPDELEYSTFEELGLRRQLFEPMLREVKRLDPAFDGLRTEDMDMLVRDGMSANTYIVEFAGKSADVTDIYHEARKMYAGMIANNVIAERYGDYRNYQFGIHHGGGFALVEDYLREWYGDKIFAAKEYPQSKKVSAIHWNVEGARRKAMAEARKAGWL